MLKFEELLAGAKRIHPDIVSVQEASRVVGCDAALAMLIVLLQHSLTDEAIERILNESGYLNIAVYLPSMGRGYIISESGEYLDVIGVDKPYKPEPSEGAAELARIMLMYGPSHTVVIPAGIRPYRGVYNMLLRDHAKFLKSLPGVTAEDEKPEDDDPPLGIGS